MKIETILNAYMKTSNLWKPERARQRAAFRARILRTDAELREGLTIANQVVVDQAIRIAKKSCQIAELEGEIDIRDKALDDSQVDLEMWRE